MLNRLYFAFSYSKVGVSLGRKLGWGKYHVFVSGFVMPAEALALEGRQDSQSISDGMKATTKQRYDDPPLGFVERHRFWVLASPLVLAVATILLRSASYNFREVVDFVFPPR